MLRDGSVDGANGGDFGRSDRDIAPSRCIRSVSHKTAVAMDEAADLLQVLDVRRLCARPDAVDMRAVSSQAAWRIKVAMPGGDPLQAQAVDVFVCRRWIDDSDIEREPIRNAIDASRNAVRPATLHAHQISR